MIKDLKNLLFSLTAKNFYWVTAGNFSIIFTGFLFTVYVARNLSPAEFGLFSAISSLILILSDLGELGIGGGLARFLPPLYQSKDESSTNKIIKTTFLLQLFISILIGSILIAFAKPIASILLHLDSHANLSLIRLSALGVVGFMMYNFINNLIIAKEDFKKTFVILNLYSIPRLVLIFFISLFLKLNTLIILLIFFIGPITAFFIGIRFTSLKFLKEQGIYSLKKLLSFSLFLALNKLFVALFSRLDIIMLTSLTSTYEGGLYSAAAKVAFLYPLIGGSLGTILGPKYSRLTISDALKFTKKVFLLVFLLVTSLIAVMILSPLIIRVVFGSAYVYSIPVLQILLLSTIPFLLAIPTNGLLTYTFKKPHILSISSLIQLLIIFSFNLIFIPRFGRLGPAISIGIAALVAMVISFISVIYYLRKK